MSADLEKALEKYPRVLLGHYPTPIEAMPNLTKDVGGPAMYIKRDDYTGLAFGGNKVRQLEFYFGAAQKQGADTVLITGAVQSNFVRLTAAAANRLGMDCHIQLEDRVPAADATYTRSGNVMLDKILGANLSFYADGEDEAGADRRVREIAARLEKTGRHPYVIPLAPGHAPLGSLGYVRAAAEILRFESEEEIRFETIVVASGSGHTHAGLLFGLRALGSQARVLGVCVRRQQGLQVPRIIEHCQNIGRLLETENPVTENDIVVNDQFLAPGYGQLSEITVDALRTAARREGVILDPTYTAKAFAGFLDLAYTLKGKSEKILFLHTGGTPALFAYQDKLGQYLSL